jgi:hypothetical protein
MNTKYIWPVFWTLVGVFIITISMTFFRIPAAFFTAGGALTLLGMALLFLTLKRRVEGILKVFLLLAGASAIGMLIFGILHNVVSFLVDTEEPVFFILAVLICPIGLLVGVIGTIILAIKGKRVKQSDQGG